MKDISHTLQIKALSHNIESHSTLESVMIYSEITLLSSWMMTSAELIRHYLAAALYAATVSVQLYTSVQDDIMILGGFGLFRLSM